MVAGQTAALALKKIRRGAVRKGMVLVDAKNAPVACWEFDADIAILTHATTIQPRYQAVIHCEIVRQVGSSVNCSTLGAMHDTSTPMVGDAALHLPSGCLGVPVLPTSVRMCCAARQGRICKQRWWTTWQTSRTGQGSPQLLPACCLVQLSKVANLHLPAMHDSAGSPMPRSRNLCVLLHRLPANFAPRRLPSILSVLSWAGCTRGSNEPGASEIWRQSHRALQVSAAPRVPDTWNQICVQGGPDQGHWHDRGSRGRALTSCTL